LGRQVEGIGRAAVEGIAHPADRSWGRGVDPAGIPESLFQMRQNDLAEYDPPDVLPLSKGLLL
jgi:hypothetical protein